MATENKRTSIPLSVMKLGNRAQHWFVAGFSEQQILVGMSDPMGGVAMRMNDAAFGGFTGTHGPQPPFNPTLITGLITGFDASQSNSPGGTMESATQLAAQGGDWTLRAPSTVEATLISNWRGTRSAIQCSADANGSSYACLGYIPSSVPYTRAVIFASTVAGGVKPFASGGSANMRFRTNGNPAQLQVYNGANHLTGLFPAPNRAHIAIFTCDADGIVTVETLDEDGNSAESTPTFSGTLAAGIEDFIFGPGAAEGNILAESYFYNKELSPGEKELLLDYFDQQYVNPVIPYAPPVQRLEPVV